MLMPSDYQHKHQHGLDSSTESAIKYLRYECVFVVKALSDLYLYIENIGMLQNSKNMLGSMRSVFVYNTYKRSI